MKNKTCWNVGIRGEKKFKSLQCLANTFVYVMDVVFFDFFVLMWDFCVLNILLLASPVCLFICNQLL